MTLALSGKSEVSSHLQVNGLIIHIWLLTYWMLSSCPQLSLFVDVKHTQGLRTWCPMGMRWQMRVLKQLPEPRFPWVVVRPERASLLVQMLFPIYTIMTHGRDHMSKGGMVDSIDRHWYTKGFSNYAQSF